MKIRLNKCTLIGVLALMTLGLASCKGLDSDTDTTKVSIDISGFLANLPTEPSSSSAAGPSQSSGQVIASPEPSEAQTAVKSLLVVPLTYSKHGKPYSMKAFDKATEKDFEDDAANSANFIQYIQLPTTSNTVEIEIPTISEGWQLLGAATVGTVKDSGEIEDAKLAYIGFTETAFKTADDFNKSDKTLNLIRHCDQDAADRPKGCATFDGSKDAIVTTAVEILHVKINEVDYTSGFPLIVRTAADVTAAKNQLKSLITNFGTTPITSITVYVTHQMSSGKSDTCKNSIPANLKTNCGEQPNTRTY